MVAVEGGLPEEDITKPKFWEKKKKFFSSGLFFNRPLGFTYESVTNIAMGILLYISKPGIRVKEIRYISTGAFILTLICWLICIVSVLFVI